MCSNCVISVYGYVIVDVALKSCSVAGHESLYSYGGFEVYVDFMMFLRYVSVC